MRSSCVNKESQRKPPPGKRPSAGSARPDGRFGGHAGPFPAALSRGIGSETQKPLAIGGHRRALGACHPATLAAAGVAVAGFPETAAAPAAGLTARKLKGFRSPSTCIRRSCRQRARCVSAGYDAMDLPSRFCLAAFAAIDRQTYHGPAQSFCGGRPPTRVQHAISL